MRNARNSIGPILGVTLLALSGRGPISGGAVLAAATERGPDLVLLATGAVAGEIDLCG